MITETNVKIHTCDADHCDFVYYQEADDDLPNGFHGNVLHVHAGGGNGGDWFACKESHIKSAVVAAANRRD